MRKYIAAIIWGLIFMNGNANAQTIQIGFLHQFRRFDYSYLSGYQGYLRPILKDFDTNGNAFSVDVLIVNGLYVNTGYLWGYTWCGFVAKNYNGAMAGESRGSLWWHQIPLRIKYQRTIFEKWKRTLWASIALGPSFNINTSYNDPFRNYSVSGRSWPASDTQRLFFSYTMNSSFHKTFVLLKGDLELGIDIMPWFTIYYTIGGAIGFKKQVEMNVVYNFEGEGAFQGTMYGKGDTWYYGLGGYFRLLPQRKTWKKEAKTPKMREF